MRKNAMFLLVYGSLILSLAGCQPIQTTSVPVATLMPTVGPTSTIVAGEEEQPMSDPDLPLTPNVELAIEDLAQRLAVASDDITVVRVEEVDWPDGSLGCPQPGMSYRQMLVNGTFIQLSVDGELYNYHSGSGRPPFLCNSKDEVLPEDLPSGLSSDPGA